MLNSYCKQSVIGAQIRARFKYFNESDTCSRYFFDLEKKSSKSKCMSHLHLEDGRTVSDSKEMMIYAREYYQKLYTPDPVDSTAQYILLSDLTQLSHDHSET